MVKRTRVKGYTAASEKLTAGFARIYGLSPRLNFNGNLYMIWRGFHTKTLADEEAEEARKNGWNARVVFRTGRRQIGGGKIKGYYVYRRRR